MPTTPTLRPSIITGVPRGVAADKARVDFRVSEFDKAIVTKGYQLAWSRAGVCPCRNNPQTDQPDINCDLCKGQGRFFFLPEVGLENYDTDGHGNLIELTEDKTGLIIMGIMTSAVQDPQIFEKFGEWVFGTMKLTVQPENKLGFRDRIIAISSTMPWSQLITCDGQQEINITGGYKREGLRYPVVDVILLRSVDTIYRLNIDFECTPEGKLRWLTTPPDADTMLSLTYTIHPVWQIVEHPHSVRDTQVSAKKQAASKRDQFTRLPVQALCTLDFLLDDES